MTDDDGTENVWKQRQRQQQMRQRRADVGSSMLFGGDAAGGGAASGAAAASSSSSSSSSSSMQQMQQMQQQSQMPGGASPPNVVQLEGTIENVERCLVKIFGIVTGDIWTPTGTIVERAAVENGVIGGRKESGMTKATTTTTTTTTTAATQASTSTSKTNASATIAPLGDPPSSTAATTHPPGRGREETPASTTAEAVIVKVWTPTSKILNLGKIRKVQRKTNTIIRRKKLRLVGSSGGGSANVSNIANEKEEDVADDNEASDNDDEEGLRESSPEGAKERRPRTTSSPRVHCFCEPRDPDKLFIHRASSYPRIFLSPFFVFTRRTEVGDEVYNLGQDRKRQVGGIAIRENPRIGAGIVRHHRYHE